MLKQLRSFIGMVQFYRDLFRGCSHILAALTSATGKQSNSALKFQWTPEMQKAFDEAKALLARDAFITYPDHNQPFHVYTDASQLQLGSVIMQNNGPVAFFSRKLNAAQQNYSTIDKELLSIEETLREYRTMLYGCKELNIHTDHKNLIHEKTTSNRVLHWRLYIEDYHPIIHYIKGTENTLADILSLFSIEERQDDSRMSPSSSHKHDVRLDDDEEKEYPVYSILDDLELAQCFVNYPPVPTGLHVYTGTATPRPSITGLSC
jgi:RNase H-like domain found in reverse transcriptase